MGILYLCAVFKILCRTKAYWNWFTARPFACHTQFIHKPFHLSTQNLAGILYLLISGANSIIFHCTQREFPTKGRGDIEFFSKCSHFNSSMVLVLALLIKGESGSLKSANLNGGPIHRNQPTEKFERNYYELWCLYLIFRLRNITTTSARIVFIIHYVDLLKTPLKLILES